MEVDPEIPKQGDNIDIRVTAGSKSKIQSITYRVNSTTNTITSVPHNFKFNSCKSTGTYNTSLNLWSEAIYNNGKIRTFTKEYDLTVSPDSREGGSLTYGLFLAHDNNDYYEDHRISQANAFFNEFESYSSYDYYWTAPYVYNCSGLCYANKYDMLISYGHGGHHEYRAGNTLSDTVDLSTTSYGGFFPCYNTGDLEYLIFASCRTLSMNDFGGHSYIHYWMHFFSTRFENRPFSGLHMVCGFRTPYSATTGDASDFMEEFAENLDDNLHVIDAWQEAVGDELDFDDADNMGTVFYIKQYENDRITTRKNDYIYFNSNYEIWYDTWE